MSHFIGLVFVPEEDYLDAMLEPFDEQSEDPAYQEFVDCTAEVKEKFDNMAEDCPDNGVYTVTEDVTDDVIRIWKEAPDELDEEQEKSFWKPFSKKEYPTPADIASAKDYEVIPDESKEGGFRFEHSYQSNYSHTPCKRKYPTLDKLAKEYFGYHKKAGKYGYYHNPLAKWDWYSEGGRWSGYIFTKDGKTTNEALITDIDWDKMFNKDEEGYDHIPFCFVDRAGSWHEKGEMGWWAMVSNEKNKDDWYGEFKEYVLSLVEEEANLPEEERTTVYAIDFHI